jgi:hypothetical protein
LPWTREFSTIRTLLKPVAGYSPFFKKNVDETTFPIFIPQEKEQSERNLGNEGVNPKSYNYEKRNILKPTTR